MNHGRVQPPAKKPDYVKEDRKTARTAPRRNDLTTKRPEHQPGNFKALKTEGNPDNRQTEQKPSDDISQRSGKTAKEQPYKISDKIHIVNVVNRK